MQGGKTRPVECPTMTVWSRFLRANYNPPHRLTDLRQFAGRGEPKSVRQIQQHGDMESILILYALRPVPKPVPPLRDRQYKSRPGPVADCSDGEPSPC